LLFRVPTQQHGLLLNTHIRGLREKVNFVRVGVFFLFFFDYCYFVVYFCGDL